MTTKVLTGTYASGYGITPPTTKLHIAASGYVQGQGVYTPGSDTGAYAVVNDGRIVSSRTGVYLTHGGSVTDGGVTNPAPLIQGAVFGVYVIGGAGTLSNFGTVLGGSSGTGVVLEGGGAVTNGAAADTAAQIQAGYIGVYVAGGTGSVTNFGKVTSGGYGVGFLAGGAVTNGSNADTAAQIQATNEDGVYIDGGAGTVTNFGAVTGGRLGVYLGGGGSVTNGGNSDTATQIQGFGGVAIKGEAGTVSNSGTVSGTLAKGAKTAGDGVYLSAGGQVANGGVHDTTAEIQGYSGVEILGALGTVTNAGTITGYHTGVLLQAGGAVTNGTNLDTGALIQGGSNSFGVYISGGTGTVANYGTITKGGAYGAGVVLDDGGSVTNGTSRDTSASIQGGSYGAGVAVHGAPGTVINHGTMTGGLDVKLAAGGSVTNYGVMQGDFAVENSLLGGVANPSTLTNLGVIAGVYDGAVFVGDSTVVNGSRKDTSASISGLVAGVGQFGNGTVVNYGAISSSLSGVRSINNGSSYGGGAYTENITNFGSIVAAPSASYQNASGVTLGELFTNSSITNFGTISGSGPGSDGLNLYGLFSGFTFTSVGVTNTTVTNHGSITGDIGVNLGVDDSNDTVVNFGTITGTRDGVFLAGQNPAYTVPGVVTGTTVTNHGSISGQVGVYVGADDLNDTVTNYGAISGTGGKAVKFDNPDDTLVVEAGSSFVGSVIGDGSTLELGSGKGQIATHQGPSGLLTTVSGSMTPTTFTNFSTVEAGAGTAFTVTGDGVIAAGQSLVAAGGKLSLATAITGSGTIAAENGGTLTADAAVSSANAMAFDSGGATLALASPSSFAATISGFGATDAIDLVKIKATSATLGSNDTLVITNGAKAVATLQLTGTYAGDTFSAASDGHGGTDITTNAPGVWPAAVTPASVTLQPQLAASSGSGSSGASAASLTAHMAAMYTLTAGGYAASQAAKSILSQHLLASPQT